LPSEITTKNKQQNVKRFEEISSFFSKMKTTPVATSTDAQALALEYSMHPNQLSAQTPLILKMSLNRKPVQGLEVQVEKQVTQIGQQTATIKMLSDAKGQAKIVFPSAGQYVITVESAEPKDQRQLAPQSYRSIVTVLVNE
jgi:uncharacterized GH25 family protein